MLKRFGPLIVAIAGAVLILLEVRRFGEGGPSVFWIVVGALALVLGVAGHTQAKQQSTGRDDDRSLPPLDRS